MAQERTTLHVKAATQRRNATAATIQRRGVAVTPPPARALQQRLGNRATQDLITRSIAAPAKERTPVAPAVSSAIPPTIQLSSMTPAKVSRPGDRTEVEAEETARKVMRMHEPPAGKPVQGQPIASKGTATGSVQRAGAAPLTAAPAARASVSVPGGSPLPTAVRSFMEPRFGANFGNVRLHTNEAAAQQSASLNANAFTIGEHVFFGQGKFQPQSDSGRALIAHELTHTIQQGAAAQRDVVHRSADVHVSEHVPPQVQGDWFDIPNPRDYFAKKAALIPGFTMLTVVIGFNPINNARVERNAGNILRGAIELMPGGALVTQALQNHGVFDRVSIWASTQFETLKDIGSSIWGEIENFIKSFSAKDLLDLGGLWDRAKDLVLRPINRIIAFAKSLFDGIVALVKEAILKPIAEFAKKTGGYPLLSTVMGKDPITGEPVAQSPETLLGAFLKFIGEEETWNTMQKANAIPRAFAWFNGALNVVRGFVSAIPGLFVQAFRALEIADIILIPRAFAKLVGVFGGFAVRFVTWGASAVWTLLEIIFDVVSPGALAYIKKTGAALRSIFRNPLPFVGNLVRAAKLGFQNFGGNFVSHLKAGLIDWLTGSLQGVYIPKALSLVELGKFAISVLGISWAQIRGKIVKALGPTGETIMKGLEKGFDIVVKLVTGGPAAVWEMVKEKLTDLKDQVVGGIISFVTDTVVKKAIPKLIAMFIPGAGFISAIISIYDTVMVFVNKIKQIAAVVIGFIDSIVAIAAGQIGAAATRVENALAGVLSLAINFLAGFAGLSKVTDKIKEVIEKVRAAVDKALDAAVAWIVNKAKKLFAKLFGKKDKPDDRTDAQKQADLDRGTGEADALLADNKLSSAEVAAKLPAIQRKYRLTRLALVTDSKSADSEMDHVEGEVNPKLAKPARKKTTADGVPKIKIVRSKFTVTTKWTLLEDSPDLHKKIVKDKGPRLLKNLDRRHVVSSQAMASHYETVLNNCKKVSLAAGILEARSEPRMPSPTNDKVQDVAQARHKRFFNDVENLFVGDASENRSIGAEKDIPKDWTEREWKKHLKYIKDNYALNESFQA